METDLILSSSPRFPALLEKSRQDMLAGRTTPHNEFWKNVATRTAAKKAAAKGK